jgi:hypothetical protein
MLTQRYTTTLIRCMATLSVHAALAFPVSGQAWLPLKGSGSVSTTYSNMYVRNHVTFNGTRNPSQGRIRTNLLLTSFEYGITDKVALSADLAYVASKWVPVPGQKGHGPNDTGSYHPAFQDAHLELRYNALAKALVVTPFIGTIIPTHDYEVRGHSAVGRGFHELLIGVNVGRQLDRVLRDSYIHARYSYAILGRFDDVALNRSNADVEVGWYANRLVSLRFISTLQKTHGGIITPFEPDVASNAHEREFHDRITRSNYIYLGGGVSFSLTRSFDIHADYLTTAYARNIQAPGGFLLGIRWNFSKGLNLIRTKVSPVSTSAQASY